MRWSVGICAVLVSALVGPAPAGAGLRRPARVSAATATVPSGVTLHTSARRVAAGDPVTLSGHLAGSASGTPVGLSASPYPYTSVKPVATTVPAADGRFSFTVVPDRNTRYSAVVAGGPTSAVVPVKVVGRTVIKVRALPLGRAEVTILAWHPRDLRWGGALVRWRFASGGGPLHAGGRTRTRRLGRFLIRMRRVITLPAGRFRFSACFHAPGVHALLAPRQPAACTGRGYRGVGSLPAGFPDASAVGRATAYLSQRTGRRAFAVIDTEGRLSGLHVHWTFPTASVVKAMLLTAYLRRLDALGVQRVDAYSNSFLYPMTHVSDNNAATQCWSIVGDSGLYTVAQAAGMTDFSVSGLWGSALLSPADQAHFFFVMDSLIPPEFVGYARNLLSTIEPSQSWAIPAVARPLGYQVFFKDGSEPTSLGQLVHQVARLEGHSRTFALAVMTDGDPSMSYGIDTIGGLTQALLG